MCKPSTQRPLVLTHPLSPRSVTGGLFCHPSLGLVTISLGPWPFRPLPHCDGPHCPWLCLHPSPAAACCQATASRPSAFLLLLQGLCSPVLWLTTGGLGLGIQQTEHFPLPTPLHLSPRMLAASQSLWCSPLRKGARAWGGEAPSCQGHQQKDVMATHPPSQNKHARPLQVLWYRGSKCHQSWDSGGGPVPR